MSRYPRISVVTPSYNQGAFLEQTILSVLEQGYPNLEYMVIDGGSTDNSTEILRKYSRYLSYWASEPDRGQAHAVIKGFGRATGEILAYQNSDDCYRSDCFRIVAKHFAAAPHADLLFGGWRFIDARGKPMAERRYGSFSLRALQAGTLVPPQTAVFFRREAYWRVGGLDGNLRQVHDYDLYIRIATRHNVLVVPEIFGDFRLHPSSKTVLDKEYQFSEMKRSRSSRLHPSPLDRLYWIAADCLIEIKDWSHRKTGVFSFREALRRGLSSDCDENSTH